MFFLKDYQVAWLEGVFTEGLSVGLVGRRFYLRIIRWHGWKVFLLKDYQVAWLEGVFTEGLSGGGWLEGDFCYVLLGRILLFSFSWISFLNEYLIWPAVCKACTKHPWGMFFN